MMPGFMLVFILLGATLFAGALNSNSTAGETPNASSKEARNAPQLYRRYCVSCHGNDGKGKTSKGRYNHARDLSDAQWQDDVSDERIFNSIMNGRNVRGNMPSFSNKLDQNEVDSLVGFVRRFRG
jgi:mono/diheme cytochrome c family protein